MTNRKSGKSRGVTEKYNQNTQRHRLYQFVWALDDLRYGKIKREILNMDPIPMATKGYGLVRWESVNEKLHNPETKESGIGVGLAVFDRNRTPIAQNHQPPRNPNYRREEDKSKLICSHSGGKKHTKDMCFHLHGFPEWWEEMKKARQARNVGRNGGGGRASAAVANDRATYTEKPAGSSGGNSNGEVILPEEKSISTRSEPQMASVSTARSWSEGKVSSIGDLAGGGSGEEGAEE